MPEAIITPQTVPIPNMQVTFLRFFQMMVMPGAQFFTQRFKLSEVIGLPVIIHARPDDFTTQPSGNSGEMIACGLINYI
jgi:Cu/Zn superoxide dismutase